jgi:hypothetical protein
MTDMVETLQDFYDLMNETCTIRREVVNALVHSKKPYTPRRTGASDALDALARALDSLESLPRQKGGSPEGERSSGEGLRRIRYGKGRRLSLDITYEIEELKKDALFLREGEDALYDYLDGLHGGILAEVRDAAGMLRRHPVRCFVTDRDGTVNNYCGRYASSVQSAYNGLFLSRFARRQPEKAVLLTSAPLTDVGLVDISVMPQGDYVYAGSKGREYLDRSGEIRTYPIDDARNRALALLNRRLQALLAEGRHEIHRLIGSGLQFKFGQTTVSRQDIYGSIPEEESLLFLDLVRSLVREIDPDERIFRIEDTGLDIEIILTIADDVSSEGVKDFDKGDGLRFLDREVGLSLQGGGNLICGDTRSDVPMVQAAVESSPDTTAVFVTGNDELKESLRSRCAHALFLTTPDALVLLLNELSSREG